MRPNQQQGCVPTRYLQRTSALGILLFALFIALFSGLFVSNERLLYSQTRRSTASTSSADGVFVRPSVGGFQFPDSNEVSNETILMYSRLNPSLSAQRDMIKCFLNATELRKFTQRYVVQSMRTPVWAPRRSVVRQQVNNWMLPFLTPHVDQCMPRFLLLSKRWLGEDVDFNPRIMQDLVEIVKKPLDQNAAYWSRKTLTDEDILKVETRYHNCAVIGNSGILLKGNHGQQIDNHEMVIRLNDALVAPYAAHVGSKTTLSFMNSNVFRSNSRGPNCWWHRYGREVPIILYICQPSHLIHLASCAYSKRTYTLLATHSLFDALCGAIAKWYSITNFLQNTGRPLPEWDLVHDGVEFHYSSGMQAVVLALGICDRVHLYGFGKSPNATHHYHTRREGEFHLHDYVAEYLFYDDLVHNRTIPFISDAGISLPPVRIFR